MEIWKKQKLKNDVLHLTNDMGFVELGRGKHQQQHDFILLNKAHLNENRHKYAVLTWITVFFITPENGADLLSNPLLIPILRINRNKY